MFAFTKYNFPNGPSNRCLLCRRYCLIVSIRHLQFEPNNCWSNSWISRPSFLETSIVTILLFYSCTHLPAKRIAKKQCADLKWMTWNFEYFCQYLSWMLWVFDDCWFIDWFELKTFSKFSKTKICFSFIFKIRFLLNTDLHACNYCWVFFYFFDSQKLMPN